MMSNIFCPCSVEKYGLRAVAAVTTEFRIAPASWMCCMAALFRALALASARVGDDDDSVACIDRRATGGVAAGDELVLQIADQNLSGFGH
jgi:hypothetical protein